MTTSNSSSWPSRIKSIAVYLVIPYIIGYLFSHGYLSEYFEQYLPTVGGGNGGNKRSLLSSSGDAPTPHQQAAPPSLAPQKCDLHFRNLLKVAEETFATFQNVSFVVHRNGDATSCGRSDMGERFVLELKKNYEALGNGVCLPQLNKYQVESILTKTFQDVLSNNDCHSVEKYGNKSKGFLGFCDGGKEHTPILLDHNDLVPVTSAKGEKSLPCRFHSREGLRVTKLDELTEMAKRPCGADDISANCHVSKNGLKEIHLYAVPAGRVFMFAPSHVGEIFYLPHVSGAMDKPIYLEVLNLEPRVFDVFNFFSREESKELVDRAIAETKESHRIKRSTTGAQSKSVNSRRTSESGFDTHGKTAVKVKKRCFKALGFDEYWESHGDGLQILRYNVSKAYNSHLDWIEDKTGQLEHDYESGGTGGNRFATILMYMSDLGPEDGGETVFPKAWPPTVPEADRIDQKQAIEQLRASPYGNVLEKGSWEEQLVASCRTRLSIRPHSSRAVLFYSQYPNGEVDPASIHGACPVLNKQKYAANLWVWNTPRTGYSGSPIKEKFRNKQSSEEAASPSVSFLKINAQFVNSGKDESMSNAVLYYEDQFWGNLGSNDPPMAVNTYEGHIWNIKVGDEVKKTIVVNEKDGESQVFSI
ncbi:2(OG)-Fe(II) oxygenase superfamily protein [Nitzschia inconspicua]|uniref:2(OG)-Fe(II) oxygenase superfamily protein n=1 Tax=Nitzschia inconspicua TaxID=303405 RepID=A0A9K3PVM9_9STRA|nr:2OG-Fe(II) oxygenase superfamily-domain containing protein [Nitzschia inconspicua]KAG7361210.1 2(OG)-Fe(II) oxygenase superfamily protein [Nitzschia inconspicua]